MRLAYHVPTHCSSCFTQQPDQQHVDFESAYDGPVLEGAIRQPIDDLIVCETCVREAGRLVGMVDSNPQAVEQLERNLALAEDRAEELERYCAGMELAIKNAPHKPVRRPPGRPRKNDMVEA